MKLIIERFDLDERIPEPGVKRDTNRSRIRTLPTGFPFLIDYETAEVVEPVLLYCWTEFTQPKAFVGGDWKKVNSADAAVSDLKDWWCRLDQSGVPWDVTDDDLVAEWLIDLRTTVSGATKDFLQDSTVNRRAATVSTFYQWAYNEGRVERVPSADMAKRLAAVKLQDGRRRNKRLPRMRGSYQADPHPIEQTLLAQFTAAMGRLPSELAAKWNAGPASSGPRWRGDSDGATPTSRDRLAFELALLTGMRIDEILNLPAAVFDGFACEPNDAFKLFELRIEHTKGLVPREVFIPYWLMAEAATYVASERSIAIAEAKRVWLKGDLKEPWQLLVNPPGAGRHVGKAAKADRIETAFRKACHSASALRQRVKAKGTREATVQEVPKHTFHDLRHTFAVLLYRSLEDMGIPRPWIRVQKLLGHAQVSTTVGTYLKVLDSLGTEALETLGRTFHAMRERWERDQIDHTVH